EDAGVMYADYLAELTPAGEAVWEWHSWEHFDPVADGIAEVQALRTLWAIGNSILELPNGDILASYRPTSTVIRIDRGTGVIAWKLGPPTLAGQHAPTPLENGNILIFDNGVHRLDDPLPFSRVSDQRNRVDVSGPTSFEFFLAAHGQCSTPAKRQYINQRGLLRTLFRSHQRRRGCL